MNSPLVHRIAILNALSAAIERRDEVMSAVWASESDEQVIAAVRGLLDCDDMAAQAVLDMSWRRLTKRNRERIALERDERAAELSGG